MEQEELGIYIHIPFCKQKCYYCDFISYAKQDNCIENYIGCLLEEIEQFAEKKENIANRKITTVYIGGGTPSAINSKYIKDIVNAIKDNYSVDEETEITIELNPGTVDEDKLKDYKGVGINRISIGLQSTNNNLLKTIGRIHTYEKFLETYNLVKKVGFDNINIDLMIGLPTQTLEDIKESLEKIIKLNPNHISVYSLIVEENTPIEKMIDCGKLELPDEDLERKMYWCVKQKLEENGYKHYEISNFAKQGYESKHNMNCWNQKEYLGFGLAAHSYLDNERYSNIDDLNKYIENIKNDEMIENKQIHEYQNKFEKEKEYMLLGLRKIDGIYISKFKERFGDNPIYLFRKELNKLVNDDLLEIDVDQIKLTNKGLDLANIVWEEFV